MLDKAIKNGLQFIDEDSGDEVIFNYRTFCQIIVGCMVYYGDTDEERAYDILNNLFIILKPPLKYSDVAFFTHEYEYHWAMLILYGDNYWQKYPNISSTLPEDYTEWEQDYINLNNLSSLSYLYL